MQCHGKPGYRRAGSAPNVFAFERTPVPWTSTWMAGKNPAMKAGAPPFAGWALPAGRKDTPLTRGEVAEKGA